MRSSSKLCDLGGWGGVEGGKEGDAKYGGRRQVAGRAEAEGEETREEEAARAARGKTGGEGEVEV